MSEETKAVSIIEQQTRRAATQYSQDDREQIVLALLGHMSDGNSLASGCLQLGVHISTVLGWIAGSVEWEAEYERLKILRSRALVEMAIGEIEQSHDNFTVKVAESRARTYLRVASLLNPKEFSDKMHTNAGKNGLGSGRVTFALHFGEQQPAQERVTIEYTPDGSELP
jgi:hypothetical protein